MSVERRQAVLFGLGIRLVLNPLYVFPQGVPTVERAEFSAEVVDRPPELVGQVPPNAILECDSPTRQRECIQARAVGYNGSKRFPETDVSLHDDGSGLHYAWDYVKFDAGFAKPNETVDTGTLVLTFEPRTRQQVMDEYATDFEDVSPLVKRTIRQGSANASQQYYRLSEQEPFVDDLEKFVERNGTYYHIQTTSLHRSPRFPRWLGAPLINFVGLVGGVALLYRLIDESQ
jgi:hypothetical protein